MDNSTLSYCLRFKCTADRCLHTCCRGWEIDIDSDTFRKYRSLRGKLGEDLRSKISTDPEPHFILSEDERCPMLLPDGLCRIIKEAGEDMICDICRDHPRYRNGDEWGIGLCCEEAARLIVEDEGPVTIIGKADTSEEGFDPAVPRAELIDIFNSAEPFKHKLEQCDEYLRAPYVFDMRDSADAFRDLEKLDPDWDRFLDRAIDPGFEFSEREARSFSNIMIYFLHRYLIQSYDEESFGRYLEFCILSVCVIASIYEAGQRTPEGLADIARRYSSEIEYSDENLEALI